MRRLSLAIALTTALAIGCGDTDGSGRGDAWVGDEGTEASAQDVLSREPYMGVSCGMPNSFACDRVGLAVWLREPAASVHASIAGRDLDLDDPEWSGPADDGERRMFAGFLQPAGLIDGPLHVTADDGPDRWIGRDPVSAPVDLTIVQADGHTTTTTLKARLSPGWG